MKNAQKTLLATVIAGSMLALAGCGGSGSGSAATQTSATTTTTTTPTLSAADKVLQAAGVPQVAWKQLELINYQYAIQQKDFGAGVPIVFAENADIGQATHKELVDQASFPNVDRFFSSNTSSSTLDHDVGVATIAAGEYMGVAPKAVIYNGITNYNYTNTSGYSDVTVAQAANGSAGVAGAINHSYTGMTIPTQTTTALSKLSSSDELFVQASGDVLQPICGPASSNALFSTDTSPKTQSDKQSCTDLTADQNIGSVPMFLDPRTKDNFIVVGEVDPSNPGTPTKQGTFPGTGSAVQATFMVAPGFNVYTAENSTGGYYQVQGTSASAPLVSGAFAIIRSAYPGLTAVQVRQILLDSANTSFSTEYQKNNCGPSANQNCGKYYFGAGMLDLEAALKLAANVTNGTATP